jgi:hypothetical protein
VLDPCAQCGIANVDRQHRVLECGEREVATRHGSSCAFQDPLRIVLADVGIRRFEHTRRQAVASGELGVDALRLSVGRLERAEQVVLEALRSGFVNLLVGLGQVAERESDVVGRQGDAAQVSDAAVVRGPSRNPVAPADYRRGRSFVAIWSK